MFRKYLLLTLLVMVFTGICSAQNKKNLRFHAGLKLGLTASQINGDNLAGYNKLGLTGGIKLLSNVSKRADVGLEILYSQRGAKSRRSASEYNYNLIDLQYIEIPIYFNLKDWLTEDKFYRMNFQAGLSYSRLFNSNTEDYHYFIIAAEEFNKSDISWLLGASYFVNRHFAISARYNRSLNKLWNPPGPQKSIWVAHFLTFDASFIF